VYTIQEVRDVDLAFGCKAMSLMPARKDIPEEFCKHDGPWQNLVGQWFFRGLEGASFLPKKGVDAQKAMRHLRAIMVSFDPKHEHKTAGCAYLLSEWFEDVIGADGKSLIGKAP